MSQTVIAAAAATRTRSIHVGAASAGAALLLAGMAMSPAATAATKVTCSPTKVTAVVSESFRYTSSTTFVPLEQAGGKFVQGGTAPSCVIVRFEGYVGTSNNAVLTIAAFIGGKPLAPSTVQLTGGSLYEARSWTFIIPSVKPGEHRIKFQYRSNNGDSVIVNTSNTIIHHAP